MDVDRPAQRGPTRRAVSGGGVIPIDDRRTIMLDIECPDCDKTLASRGYVSHSQHKHGVPKELASRELRMEKEAAEAGKPRTVGESDWTAPSDPGPALVEPSESSAPPDDPRLQELDRQIEETRRLAELERLRAFLENDDKSDSDVLEQIARMKELGLLGGGDDGGRSDAVNRAILQEIRSLRENGGAPAGGGGGGGGGGGDVGGGLVGLALSSGVTDENLIATLAETQPAVAEEKYRWKREELKWDRRDQLVRDVVDRLTAPEVAKTLTTLAFQAVGGSGGAGEAAAAVAEAGQDPQDSQGGAEAAEERAGGLRPVEEPTRGEAPPGGRSPAAQRHAERLEGEDPFEDEAEPVEDEGEAGVPVGEFRSPDG